MRESPIRRHRYFPVYVASVLVVAAFAGIAWALHVRSDDLNRTTGQLSQILFDQCVANERQDAVIVAQLEAAKRRARSSLPAHSSELQYQLQILNDGIQTLEPPDEPDCNPPKGNQP